MLGHHLEGAHGAESADVADRHALLLGLDRLHAGHDGLALLLGLLEKPFLLEGVEDAEGRSTGHRIAGIGAADAARIGASMILARPTTAASGNPPASDLAAVMRSASTP